MVSFLVNDALDDILTESGDEDEEQSVINQVLDEIGIEITSKVKYIFSKTGKKHLGEIFIFYIYNFRFQMLLQLQKEPSKLLLQPCPMKTKKLKPCWLNLKVETK